MYSLLKTIKSGLFEIVNSKLLYSSHKLFYDDKLIYEGNPTSFNVCKSIAFIIDNFEKLVVIDLSENKIINELNYIDGIDLIINKDEIIYGVWNQSYTTRNITRINIKTEQKKWTVENYFGNGEVYGHFLYATSVNNTVCRIDLNQPDQPLWQFDLNELSTLKNKDNQEINYNVIKILGIWQDELFIACNNGLLLSLDINTGNEKYRWQHINNYEFDSEIKNRIPRAESFIFDGNTLIGALNTFYFKIDLQTSEITATNISEKLQKFNIFHIKTVSDNPVTDKHIYLTAMTRQIEGNTKFSYDCLIALNKKTLEIDWHYAFEDAGLGTNIPKLGDNKLYQLDTNNTLHIFEKIQNKLP